VVDSYLYGLVCQQLLAVLGLLSLDTELVILGGVDGFSRTERLGLVGSPPENWTGGVPPSALTTSSRSTTSSNSFCLPPGPELAKQNE